MEKINWEELAQILLEDKITMRGVYDTIRFLLDCGYSMDDLIELGFSEDDIIHCEEEDGIND